MIKFDYIVERPKSEILYILFKRYVSTLWSIAWHTLSTWVNEGPHWNRWILSLLNVIKWIIHFQVVQHLGADPCMSYSLHAWATPSTCQKNEWYWKFLHYPMLSIMQNIIGLEFRKRCFNNYYQYFNAERISSFSYASKIWSLVNYRYSMIQGKFSGEACRALRYCNTRPTHDRD